MPASGKMLLLNPMASNRGRAIFTEEEPVRAKTVKMINTSKLLVMPHRCFNLFISKIKSGTNIGH